MGGVSVEKSIVKKVKEGLKNVGLGYFDTGESCEYDAYYRYFGVSDFETRQHALAAFTVMLGNWHSSCSFAFTPKHEREDTPDIQSYELNDYIEAFVHHHEQIEQDFPYMHEYIVTFLIRIEIDKGIPYEEWFPEVDPLIVKQLKEEVLIPKRALLEKKSQIKLFLKEADIQPFFKSDIFD